MKTLSLNRVIGTGIAALKNSIRRFPVSIGFTLALTVYSLLLIWGEDRFTERQETTAIYYLTMGILLSLTLQLWGEEVKRRWIVLAANLSAHAILIADALYLYRLPERGFSIEIGLAHGAVITALVISVFFGSFFREKDDIPAKNFALQIVGKAGASLFVGLIMWGGTAMLLASLRALFQIEISGRCFATLPLLCCQMLPTLLFLGLIPAGEMKHDPTTIIPTDFQDKTIRYLILPLLAGYLLVLYAYTAKILVEWQLPDGWVSKLVTALMAGCIGIETAFYPSWKKGEKRFNRFITQWLPLVILPMLLLMTVGIFRRINDYGITLNRLYLLTLNGWFYLVCIGLFLTRAKRIHWIPVSFGIIFLLTSVFPVNYAGITRNYMKRHVTKAVDDTYHGTLPMSEEQYFDWIGSLPREEALSVNSRLRYLDFTFDDPITDKLFRQDSIAGVLVTQSPSYYEAENHILEMHSSPTEKVHPLTEKAKTYFIRFQGKQTWELPATTYAGIVVYAEEDVEFLRSPNDSVSLLLTNGHQTDTVRISFSDLDKWNSMNKPPLPKKFSCTPSGDLFILTGLDFPVKTIDADPEKDKVEISGYRLTGKKE